MSMQGGLLPHVISFNTAIIALENVGQWQRVALFFEEMCMQGGILPHVISFNTAIIALGNVGQWKHVAALLFVDENAEDTYDVDDDDDDDDED
eukprot:7577152-Karenia_brevis.AAC.1